MRDNKPVTQFERHLNPKRPLVSVTDLKGNIIHVNPSFVEVSGFDSDELIGQPHNIIRHPDMPKEAFDDLWRTIKSDLPWRGMVKNRCKNGDYYWVYAYVTPIFERGMKTGYISVRTRPESKQVIKAEELYSAVRHGRSSFPATRYSNATSATARIALLTAMPALLSLAALLSSDPTRWVVCIVGIFVAFGIGFWTWSGIASPLKRLGDAMLKISAGDLGFEVDTRAAAEFSHLLIGMQSMRVHLRAMFADMLGIAGDIKTQSSVLNDQVTTATQHIRQGADSISTMAAAVEELSSSIKEISINTRNSAGKARATADQVERGVRQMSATQAASQNVVTRMDGAQKLIVELDREVASIQKLAETIKGIADQTNLLALNAAIEAARAGASGRGFAVVADEVRNLAERTAGSTVEIAETLERIGTTTAMTLAAMEDAACEVKHSNQMIMESQLTYEAIRNAADDIQKSSSDIADMLQQQNIATAEVAGHIEQINHLMLHNSDSVESVREASAQFRETALQLDYMTNRFEPTL